MNRTILAALLSHWWRNRMQLFTLLAGLALATALWSGVQAINTEARASYDAAAQTLGEGQYDQIRRSDGGLIPLATYIDLRRAGLRVSPVIEDRLNGVRLVGVDPLTAPGGIGPVDLTNDDFNAFLTGRGQVYGTAEALTEVGEIDADRVTSPDVAPGTLLTDIAVAQRLLNRADGFDRLIAAPGQTLLEPALSDIAPDLSRQSAQGAENDLAQLTDSFHLNLTAFGLLSFAVGIFIVNGAIGLAFEQRRPVVRTLRALGVPLDRLLWMTALELCVFALVAGIVGVAMGYGIASLLLPDVAATLRGLYGAQVAGTLSIRPVWWLSSLAIALGGTALAAGAAFWRLYHMPLLAAGQQRALAMAAGRSARWQAWAALVLLTVAAVLVAAVAVAGLEQGLVAGFAMLACLLIGAALALPYLLDRVLTLGQAMARGVLPQWFWADTRQQLPGLSLALMALLLAMSANIGVSTMVSSFRQTFVDFLDQRLAAELYVTAEDAAQAQAIQAFAEPRTRAILPILSTDISLADQPVALLGARDDATYRDNWTFLVSSPAPWDAIAAGDAIAINEQLWRRTALDIGQEVTVNDRSFTIAAVYSDYGNPTGQAIMTEAAFRTLFPDLITLQFGLRLPPEKVPDLVDDMERTLGLPEGATIDQSGIKAFSLGVFDRTFTVTTALNILTLAVAGFAILMSLLTLATMRLPQLAPVWAMGLTRAGLGRLELVRALLLATLTAVVALPLGLALAWVLLSVVNVAAFGWKLPMFLYPLDYARLGLFALVAAALAALWPAIRLARTPPADLLKVFSNER